MHFAERVRELREQQGFTQQELAEVLDVSVSYVNKVERGRLNSGEYPSAKFIHKLADALGADEDELLLLSDRVPEDIRKRIRERPEAFRRFAELDDRTMDRLLKQVRSRSR